MIACPHQEDEALRLLLRKIRVGWTLGPGRLLGIVVYGAFARVGRLFSVGPAEARDFVVNVVSSGGRVSKGWGQRRCVRVEQPVAGLEEPFTALLRPGTSDLAVWMQIVHGEQYASVARVLETHTSLPVETIVDLGANIGLAARYFSAVYPSARILAVEPDPANYRMLVLNTEDLRDAVVTVAGAFWPREEALSWAPIPFRDGRAWARAVGADEGGSDAAGIQVVTPRSALERLGVDRVDLVKMDIEGAEAEFFTSEKATKELLDMARAVVMEVHAEALDPVQVSLALDKAGFVSLSSGELLIAVRREYLR